MAKEYKLVTIFFLTKSAEKGIIEHGSDVSKEIENGFELLGPTQVATTGHGMFLCTTMVKT